MMALDTTAHLSPPIRTGVKLTWFTELREQMFADHNVGEPFEAGADDEAHLVKRPGWAVASRW